MEEYAEIVEIETADPRVLLDHVPTMTGLIVPYTNEKLITKEVLDRESTSNYGNHLWWNSAKC